MPTHSISICMSSLKLYCGDISYGLGVQTPLLTITVIHSNMPGLSHDPTSSTLVLIVMCALGSRTNCSILIYLYYVIYHTSVNLINIHSQMWYYEPIHIHSHMWYYEPCGPNWIVQYGIRTNTTLPLNNGSYFHCRRLE